MKNGMRIGAVLNLLAGLLMVVLAVLPLVQGKTIKWDKVIGLGVGGLVCLGVGVLLFAMSGKMGSILGLNDPLLTTGQPAKAVIKAVRETGITLQHGMYAIMDFNLEVNTGMGSPYPVTCRSTVPRISLSMVGLGKTVAVMVDPANPNRVAINWNALPS